MAKNDTILLDGIIDQRLEDGHPSKDRGEVFERLVFEQILKEHDLAQDEFAEATVDGEDDGGIDGFFLLVNGHLVSDTESFVWPKAGAELDLWVVTCKHQDSFKQIPLDKLVASLVELFDFSVDISEMKGQYSQKIINARNQLSIAYRRLSPRLKNFYVNVVYASRGDTSKVSKPINSRAEQIIQIVRDSFSNCEVNFKFYGSAELVECYRESPNYSLELPFHESLSHGDSYLLLSDLTDYFKFVTDDNRLRRYLFDSNVRDFMGLNRVNEDIRKTLQSNDSPNFWWLNNGVTILASGASVFGKSIRLEGIQIVNGLQTTESIFRHFNEGGVDLSNRSVLVKVIVSNDSEYRDDIIRSTNNQTIVEVASLHATDRIQRNIEDILKQHGYLYERRKNYYQNLGYEHSEIITPIYIAAGFVALVQRNPAKATRLKARFMRFENSYGAIFSEHLPIQIWITIAAVLKKADRVIESRRPTIRGKNYGENFQKGWRNIIGFLTVAKIIGKMDYSVSDVAEISLESIESSIAEELLDILWRTNQFHGSKSKPWRRNDFVAKVCERAAKQIGLTGFSAWNNAGPSRDTLSSGLRESFINAVNDLLPDQPWKPGAHLNVVRKLGCSKQEYFAATKVLIERGLRNNQRDGIVYDEGGHIIAIDHERVDSETLQLK